MNFSKHAALYVGIIFAAFISIVGAGTFLTSGPSGTVAKVTYDITQTDAGITIGKVDAGVTIVGGFSCSGTGCPAAAGTIIGGMWCAASLDAGLVICDKAAPVAAEVDPSIVTKSVGGWCWSGDGGVVSCDKGTPVMTEVDPKISTMTPNAICMVSADGGVVICTSGEADPVFTGSAAYNITTQNITDWTGQKTATKWCASSLDAGMVICDKDAPVLAESDPTIVAKTVGGWCWSGDGGVVSCNLAQPVMSEVDPKIAAMTVGGWCWSGDGGVMSCDLAAPVLAEVDPKLITITPDQWCKASADGGGVVCNVAPQSNATVGAVYASTTADGGYQEITTVPALVAGLTWTPAAAGATMVTYHLPIYADCPVSLCIDGGSGSCAGGSQPTQPWNVTAYLAHADGGIIPGSTLNNISPLINMNCGINNQMSWTVPVTVATSEIIQVWISKVDPANGWMYMNAGPGTMTYIQQP